MNVCLKQSRSQQDNDILFCEGRFDDVDTCKCHAIDDKAKPEIHSDVKPLKQHYDSPSPRSW